MDAGEVGMIMAGEVEVISPASGGRGRLKRQPDVCIGLIPLLSGDACVGIDSCIEL